MNRNDIAISYREAAVRGAGQAELVVMLYDILFDDIRGALEAIRTGDIESRTSEIKHALSVLEQLQGTLDFEHGGEAARHMDRLYSMVRAKILEAHMKTSAEILQKQIDLLTPVREAWQQLRPLPAQAAGHTPPTEFEAPTTTEWRI
jgi:flagellar secretion chaperone FliS